MPICRIPEALKSTMRFVAFETSSPLGAYLPDLWIVISRGGGIDSVSIFQKTDKHLNFFKFFATISLFFLSFGLHAAAAA